MLSKVCKDVMIEPSLHSRTGETFPLLSTITDDGVRLDEKARDFYRLEQCAFFDIRVAHLNARSYGGLSTETILERPKKEKKRKYNTRVIEVEHGTFTPLYSAQMEPWVEYVPSFTNVLLPSWQRRTKRSTLRSCNSY